MRKANITIAQLTITLLLMIGTQSAMAGAAQGLPWEVPAETVATSLMFTMRWIALIGFFAAGGILVFGGELPEWGRRVAVIVLALSVALGGVTFVDTLFTTSGAVAGA